MGIQGRRGKRSSCCAGCSAIPTSSIAPPLGARAAAAASSNLLGSCGGGGKRIVSLLRRGRGVALCGGHRRHSSSKSLPGVVQVALGFAGLLVTEGERAFDAPYLGTQLRQVHHGSCAAAAAVAVPLTGAATRVMAASCPLLLLLEVGTPVGGSLDPGLRCGQLCAQPRVLCGQQLRRHAAVPRRLRGPTRRRRRQLVALQPSTAALGRVQRRRRCLVGASNRWCARVAVRRDQWHTVGRCSVPCEGRVCGGRPSCARATAVGPGLAVAVTVGRALAAHRLYDGVHDARAAPRREREGQRSRPARCVSGVSVTARLRRRHVSGRRTQSRWWTATRRRRSAGGPPSLAFQWADERRNHRPRSRSHGSDAARHGARGVVGRLRGHGCVLRSVAA